MSPSMFGFAVRTQHCSRRSNYKQGSSGQLRNTSRVQEFPQWRKCDHIWTSRHHKHRASVPLLSLGPKPTGLCSLPFDPETFWTQLKSIFVSFVYYESWERFCFFCQDGCTGLQQKLLCHSWWEHAWLGQRLNPLLSSPFWGGKKSLVILSTNTIAFALSLLWSEWSTIINN